MFPFVPLFIRFVEDPRGSQISLAEIFVLVLRPCQLTASWYVPIRHFRASRCTSKIMMFEIHSLLHSHWLATYDMRTPNPFHSSLEDWFSEEGAR